jgi:hypothetical protein
MWIIGCAVLAASIGARAGAAPGRVVDLAMESAALAGNLLGVATHRALKVYLPPGYERGARRYPVVYYFHNSGWSPRQLFEENRLDGFFDRAIGNGVLAEVIVVAPDLTTPTGFNFFSNEPTSGRWLDHIVDEVVPLIDARFRTLARPASRALVGDFFGGYAALKLALLRTPSFGAVYALHPVGTGAGLIPGVMRPDWRRMNLARSWDDLAGDGFSMVFTAMAQAYLPNPGRPPFYCDFPVDLAGDALVVNEVRVRKLKEAFLLASHVPAAATSLKRLRGIALDWGRYDTTTDHVVSNAAFSRLLDEYGVTHIAEEYSGNQWDRLWVPGGRIEADLIPFIARHVAGAAPARR